MKKCEKCGHEFDNEWKYQRHVSRKTPCDLIVDHAIDEECTELMCKYCGKELSNLYNLNRHVKSCQIRTNLLLLVDRELRTQCKKLKEEVELLKIKLQEIELIQNNDNSVNIDGDHNNLNVQNNIHNGDNYYGDVICFNREAVQELIEQVLSKKNGNKHRAKEIKTKIVAHLSAGDMEGLFEYMFNVLHNNDNYPQGKNIFKAKSGPHKGSYVVLGANGWHIADSSKVLEVSKSETIDLVGIFSWEPESSESHTFIEKFNNGSLDSKVYKVLDKVVKKFDLSKKNPKVKIGDDPDGSSDSSDTSSDTSSEK